MVSRLDQAQFPAAQTGFENRPLGTAREVLRRAFSRLRAVGSAIVEPISDEERFFHTDLVRRDAGGRPAHDMPLTTPTPRCVVFSQQVGPAHYHIGRRSTDGALLVAFAGTACPAALHEESDTSERLRVAS